MLAQRPSSIMDLTYWKLEQPECKDWVAFSKLDEQNAVRSVSMQLRSVLTDIARYSSDYPLEQIVQEIIEQNPNILYGVCDHYHMIHEQCRQWIERYKLSEILDYYGKTGEFSLRTARIFKRPITYVDQNTWLKYAQFRLRLHHLAAYVRCIEATQTNYRPTLNKRFDFISTLDIPIKEENVDNDYMNWLTLHMKPYGLVASRVKLPLKTVAKLEPFGYISQWVPPDAIAI